MSRVLVITHSEGASAGWLGSVLDAAGIEARYHPMHTAGAPDLRSEGAVVVLGGAMGAYEEAEHPFLIGEKQFIRDLVADGVPVLGICLGSQLVADALGGRAYLAPVPEVGYLVPERTTAGMDHPVLSTLEEPVLVIHQDTFDLPPGAELLAATEGYPHAFQVGSALALQFHAEATPEILAGWMDRAGLQRLVARAGREPGELMAESRDRSVQAERQGVRLFRSWVDTVFAGPG